VKPIHLLAVLLALVVIGCDSMELTINVRPGSDATLVVANANDIEWSDALLVVESVESDNSTTLCTERRVGTWRPGEEIAVAACGNKIRLTLTTGGETARFSYANGQLFRRFGRKEVPVVSS
jgi:hypothetical protein